MHLTSGHSYTAHRDGKEAFFKVVVYLSAYLLITNVVMVLRKCSISNVSKDIKFEQKTKLMKLKLTFEFHGMYRVD